MTKRLLPALLLTIALLSGVAAAQSVVPTPRPHQNFVDQSGNACNACSLYTYLAGTTTPTPTYTDYTGSSANPNPIVLDAAGGAQIWLTPGLSYKFILCEGPTINCLTAGGTTQWSADGIQASGLLAFTVTTFTQLQNAVTLCSTGSCSLLIAANIAIPSNFSIPANISLAFSGGQLQPATSTTTTIAGTIADTTAQIFGGAGSIAGLVRARPEWFGGAAAANVLAAYNAIATGGGDLVFQVGSYVSPFNQVSTTIGTKNSVRWIGAGEGDYNGSATAVVGGTIIQGQLQINASYNVFRDLCIDDGSAVIAALFSSGIGNGLEMATSGSAPYKGINVANVCVLNSSATAAVHDMLFENVDGLFATNLKTLFGTHGVILKGIHSTIVGIHGRGHNSDCFIPKVDSGIPFLDDSITDVHCESYNALDTGLGGGGIFISGGTGGGLAGLTISGVTMRALGGPCIGIGANTGTTIADLAISDVNCDTPGSSPAVGIWLQNLGGTIQRTHITNLNVNNATEGIRVDANAQNTQVANLDVTNATDAIYNNGGAYTQIVNARCSNCSGYTVNWVVGYGSQEGIEGYTSGGAYVATPWQAASGTSVNDVTFGSLTQGRGPIATNFAGGNFNGTNFNGATMKATSGLIAGAAGSTIADTRSLIQSITFCTGGTVACTQTTLQSAHSVVGFASLTAGTVTITGIPAYTSLSTYWCTVVDDSATAAVRWVPVSGTSFTITGTGADTVIYSCNGY